MEMTLSQFIRRFKDEKNKMRLKINKVLLLVNMDVREFAIRNVQQRLNKSGTSRGVLKNSISIEIENGQPIVTAGGAGIPYAAIHEYGGRIIPKNVNWLTIPNGKEYYGKKARDFDLYFRLINPSLGALFDKNTNKVVFWLKREITIKKKSYLTDAGNSAMNRNKEKLKQVFGSDLWRVD
jgi:phage gpG-like protein